MATVIGYSFVRVQMNLEREAAYLGQSSHNIKVKRKKGNTCKSYETEEVEDSK